VGIPCNDFPTDNESISVWEEHESSNPPVISDSLDKHGHTVSIRDGTNKLIKHRKDNNTIKKDVTFQYRTDPTERESRSTEAPQELYESVNNILSSERNLLNIKGEFSKETKQQLKDLGYIIGGS
jgi:hypothetical protein